MKSVLKQAVAITLLAAAGMQPVLAEEDPHSMQGMDHGNMQMSADEKKREKKDGNMNQMDHSGHDMSGMDHGSMKMPAADQKDGNMNQMDHGGHNMSGMDHGSMSKDDAGMGGMDMGSMQGGKAPADARDPHAYADGFTLAKGPYVLPPADRLRLADEHHFASLLVDRLESVQTADGNSAAYDLQAWFGRDYDRAVLKSEGEYANGVFAETSTELLWSHAVSSFWNRELGVRYDGGEGPGRSWLAFGFQGLAPYWFEVDATAYVGEGGNTALGLEAEYELLFTQKLILQTRAEASVYGQDDAARGIGSGLSEMAVGVRLRYEVRREFAPYVGIEWAGKFGGTADYASLAGEPTDETKLIAGLRFWF